MTTSADDGPVFGLRDGMDLAGIDLLDLWLRYVASGGNASPVVFAARVAGNATCSDDEHDLIALVLNEVFLDRGVRSSPVGYRGPSTPATSVGLTPAVRAKVAEARDRAAEARQRSRAAARQAATLHLLAAQLMEASGRLLMAHSARTRASRAQARGLAV